MQALTEAPILARADGYLKRRLADMGDRVQAGQVLAEIDAPELDQQIHQAEAAIEQAQAAAEQAEATSSRARRTASSRALPRIAGRC
jgi:multidrug efflux pump subunit AcrA (membrane-fusion protein)